MEFTKLEVKDYPSFLALYNETFPADQRRIYHDEAALERFINEHHGKFHALAAKDGELFLGFLSYWTFKGYVYIEHFAVSPEHRGRNLGGLMLEHLMRTVSENVLIEVEHPDDDDPDTERRIRFYERHGFRRSMEFDYVQPPYHDGGKEVRLLLMRHGDVKLDSRQDVKEMLREVYNVEE